jgi:hypothetical protein
MRVLMVLSAYKQAKFEWILRIILKLETQNVIYVFIEIYVQFYNAHMWLQMTMSAQKNILWITQMWSQPPNNQDSIAYANKNNMQYANFIE